MITLDSIKSVTEKSLKNPVLSNEGKIRFWHLLIEENVKSTTQSMQYLEIRGIFITDTRFIMFTDVKHFN
jgi:hypothetical protein